MIDQLHDAAERAGWLRESSLATRLRVTPAVHQELAEYVCEGTGMNADATVLQSWQGMVITIDPDVPDPGWQVEAWPADTPDATPTVVLPWTPALGRV